MGFPKPAPSPFKPPAPAPKPTPAPAPINVVITPSGLQSQGTWAQIHGGGGGGSSTPAPTISGGAGMGYSGVGGEVKPIVPSPTDTQKGVEQFAQQVKLQEKVVKEREVQRQEKLADSFFGKKQSRKEDIFVEQLKQRKEESIQRSESQLKSVAPPTQGFVEAMRGSLGIEGEKVIGSISPTTGIQVGNIKERFTTTAKISAETANLALRGIKNQEIADYYARNQNNIINKLTEESKNNFNKQINSQESQDFLNSLKERANNGEDIDKLNKEWDSYQNGIIKNVDKNLKDKYNKWFDDFKNNEGKNFEAEAIRDIIKFNARYGSPRFNEIKKEFLDSFKGGVVVGGVTGTVQGLGLFQKASRLPLIGGIVKASRKVVSKVFSTAGQGVLGVGYSVVNLGKRGIREGDLQKTYGFTEGEAYKIAEQESLTGFINVGTSYGGFMAGAGLTHTIVSKGLTTIQVNRVNNKANEFLKELEKSPELQQKYITASNVKKGYFEKTIDGYKIKVPINENTLARYSGRVQGTDTSSNLISVGVNEQLSVQTALMNKGIDISGGATISKINVRTSSKLTNQQIGRIDDRYIVSIRSGDKSIGYSFKLNAKGEAYGIKPFTQKFNVETGVSTIESASLIKKVQRAEKGGFIFETQAVKNQRLFQTKVDKGIRSEKGGIIFSKQNVEVAKLKGSRSLKDESASLFDGKEPLGAFYSKGRIDIINPKKAKITQVGEAKRIRLFRDVNSPNVKGRSELFLENIRTKTPKSLVDIIPQKPTKNLPKSSKVDESPSILFDKPMKIETPTPKPSKPTQEVNNILVNDIDNLPSIVGGKGQGTSQQNMIMVNRKALIDVEQTLEKSAGLVFAEPKSLSLNLKSQPVMLKIESRPIGMLQMQPQLEQSLIRKDMLFAEPDLNKDYIKMNMNLGLLTKTGSGLKVGIIQQQVTQQIPRQESILFNPTITKKENPRNPKIETPLKPIDFGFFGGKVNPEVGGGQRGKAPSGGIFGGTKYNPSLGSILLRQKPVKVTKAEAERLRTKTYSGLELRPQIQIVNKNKKRKSLFSI